MSGEEALLRSFAAWLVAPIMTSGVYLEARVLRGAVLSAPIVTRAACLEEAGLRCLEDEGLEGDALLESSSSLSNTTRFLAFVVLTTDFELQGSSESVDEEMVGVLSWMNDDSYASPSVHCAPEIEGVFSLSGWICNLRGSFSSAAQCGRPWHARRFHPR